MPSHKALHLLHLYFQKERQFWFWILPDMERKRAIIVRLQIKIELGWVIKYYLRIVNIGYIWDLEKGDGNWSFQTINIHMN